MHRGRGIQRVIFATLVVALVGALLPSVALAGDEASFPSDRATSRPLAALSLRAGRVSRHPTGVVRLLGASLSRPLRTARELGVDPRAGAEAVAWAFLRSDARRLGVGSERGLEHQRTVRTEDGRSLVRFGQRVRGVPVLGAELVIQVGPRGEVVSVNGEALPDVPIPTRPLVRADIARVTARDVVLRERAIGDARMLVAGRPSLVIHDARILGGPGRAGPRLAWRVDVRGLDPWQAVSELVLVDALHSSVILHFDQTGHALSRVVCDDAKVNDPTSCPDGDARVARTEGGAASSVAEVNNAYDYAGDTYALFRSRFGRDSLDGNGMTIRSNVRVCDPASDSCVYSNAFWSPNTNQVYYGDGFARADDVVAHELTHGVTQFTSRLFYWYQSGAINESLSDIFGELVDLSNTGARGPGTGGTDTPEVRWLHGEDLPGGANRDMQDPGAFWQPDRMSSEDFSTGAGDQGGVHKNSGVGNKAAYLLVDGTGGEAGGAFNGQTFAGLGVSKTGRLFYEAARSLLTSASDYQDLYWILQQACVNLVGNARSGFSLRDCEVVKQAVTATEMHLPRVAYPFDATPEAPLCAPQRAAVDAFLDDMENASALRWTAASLISGGPNAWGYSDLIGFSGRRSLYGVPPEQVSDSTMTLAENHAITVPNVSTESSFLHLRHAFAFEQLSGGDRPGRRDGGVIEYRTRTSAGQAWGAWTTISMLSGGAINGYNENLASGTDNPLEGDPAFTGRSGGFIASRWTLDSVKGKQLQLRFRTGSDAAGTAMGWRIDDVRVYRCTPDTAGPTGSAVINGNAQWTNSASVTVASSASDALSGVSLMRISNGSAVDSAGLLRDAYEIPYRTSFGRWSLTDSRYGALSTADGIRDVYAQYRDGAGNWSSVRLDRIILDRVAPTVGAPTHHFATGTTVALTGPPVPVAILWSTSDDRSGIASVRLGQRQEPATAFTDVPLSHPRTSVAAVFLAPSASRYQFRGGATDRAGNARTGLPGALFRVGALQDGQLSRSGTWTGLSSSSRYYGGTAIASSSTSATATATVSGTHLALVVTKGPDRGKLAVRLGTAPAVEVDLYASTVQHRQVITLVNGGSLNKVPLELRPTGGRHTSSTGTTVVIDALLVMGA